MVLFSESTQAPARSAKEREYLEDILALLGRERFGHMERWEYDCPKDEGDLAAGACHWAALIRNPGKYYLVKADAENIVWAIKQPDFLKKISGTKNLLELGPGCEISLEKKTLPFYKSAPGINSYTAIDGTIEIARNAAEFIARNTGVAVSAVEKDYFSDPVRKKDAALTSIIFWGSSLGNLEGDAVDNPLPKLSSFLGKLNTDMSAGDTAVLSFDTETDRQTVLDSYLEPDMHRQVLSVIHRLKRDSLAEGGFDPSVWQHEPVWIEDSMQCAHYLYPTIDQHFRINGNEFSIRAGTRFLSNNSYKYTNEQMLMAAKNAGFSDAEIFQKGPMALLVATK
jgi:uncharacterized SAM-dependent methyltransferase